MTVIPGGYFTNNHDRPLTATHECPCLQLVLLTTHTHEFTLDEELQWSPPQADRTVWQRLWAAASFRRKLVQPCCQTASSRPLHRRSTPGLSLEEKCLQVFWPRKSYCKINTLGWAWSHSFEASLLGGLSSSLAAQGRVGAGVGLHTMTLGVRVISASQPGWCSGVHWDQVANLAFAFRVKGSHWKLVGVCSMETH